MDTATTTRSTTIDELVGMHGAALLRYTTRLMNGDSGAAEDVVQETWLRAWRHLDKLTEQHGPVRGWLTRVAHNIAMDHHRARKARPSEVAWSELDSERAPSLDDPAAEVEDRVVVDSLLRSVSEQHRETVVEVYFADHTASVAATALGVPVGTVKSRIFHALRAMRANAGVLAA